MGFFKKLFSSKNNHETGKTEAGLPDIYSDEYFKKRYKEESLHDDPFILDGCMRMFEGYFIATKLEKKVQQQINHPINLDQVVDEGFGFQLYCKALNLEDNMIISFLAMGFADFLIKKYGFKLYKDSEPEFPLRTMTLKYDINGTFLSLYPFEYTAKVLRYESSFEDLHQRIDSQMGNIPGAEEIMEQYLARLKKEVGE